MVMSDERKMTLGESRVRISFNPSRESMVDKIKQSAAAFIDLCETLKPGAPSEVARRIALAQTHAEDAAMWAVKAATAGK